MILGVIVQQPADVLDYDVSYEQWIGDTIDSVTTNIIGEGTLNVSSQISGDSIVKLWLMGGADGEQYTVEVNTAMASGRVKQDEFIVQIKDFK